VADSRERFTLVAGRIWDAAKNVSLVARAAQGWDPGNVYLAGESAHPDGGRAVIPGPLQPLGQLSRADLDALLRRASIYISPARYDPFGLLPLQAALNGCALLLSDIPSYRELWDGVACFFRADDGVAETLLDAGGRIHEHEVHIFFQVRAERLHLLRRDGGLVARLRGRKNRQRFKPLVLDQGLAQLAPAFGDFDDVENDAFLEPEHEIEIAQTDIRVHEHDAFAAFRESGAEIRGGRRLTDAAFP